ncbi:MAG: hypothetical protein ACLUGF_05480 [Clostridium sp.]
MNEANRIQHLNAVEGIAKVYDCVAENDTGYVISEYVEGETLQQILDGGKVFLLRKRKHLLLKFSPAYVRCIRLTLSIVISHRKLLSLLRRERLN